VWLLVPTLQILSPDAELKLWSVERQYPGCRLGTAGDRCTLLCAVPAVPEASIELPFRMTFRKVDGRSVGAKFFKFAKALEV